MRKPTSAVLCAVVFLSGCQPEQPQESKAPVAEAQGTVSAPSADPAAGYPTTVYWGDSHVHTGWSTDAGLALTTVDPEGAVRFARGEEVTSSTGEPARLRRALDWVAVTDHSDGMGTIGELIGGNPEMMADETVKRWHDLFQNGEPDKASREVINAQAAKDLPAILMDPKWTRTAWEKSVDIMERYNEPGTFTAFIAYEWTSNGEQGENLHRNVIFRDGADRTRATPPLTTFVSAAPGRSGTDPESLWQWLSEWESGTGGQVLAIPHNGNMSNGWMFRLTRYDGSDMTAEWAEARARWEPLYEIFQYKGQGEAHPALAPMDEFAAAEIWDTADLSGHAKRPGDIEFEYWRDALKNGMAVEEALGINPFKYGAVSGTDTHIGLMTGGEEDNYWGKFVKAKPAPGRGEKVARQEESYVRKEWTYAAAGLTGVWATGNTRAALWDAMKRREVYASSGPRMTLRLFGGFDFEADVAEGELVSVGYAKGVPMGGELSAAPAGRAPSFLLAAAKDPVGANLDRLQLVKGWIDANGETHEKIYDVVLAGDRVADADGRVPPVGNTVDVTTAEYANSIGSAELRGQFTDPEFDPAQRAFYYARVIEIPTPRWTLYDAVRYQQPVTNPDVPLVIQERAVSSPIWYSPGI